VIAALIVGSPRSTNPASRRSSVARSINTCLPHVSQRSPIPGLYFSGYTTDTEGQDYDADACGALRAADMIIADRKAGAAAQA